MRVSSIETLPAALRKVLLVRIILGCLIAFVVWHASAAGQEVPSKPPLAAKDLAALSDVDLLSKFRDASLDAGATDSPLAWGNPADFDWNVILLRGEIVHRGKRMVPLLIDMLRDEIILHRPAPAGSEIEPGMIGDEVEMLVAINDSSAVKPLLDIASIEDNRTNHGGGEMRTSVLEAVARLTYASFHKVLRTHTGSDEIVERPGALAEEWSDPRPQLLKLYRDWLAGEGKDPSQWLPLAQKRAHEILEADDLDAAWCAARFLAGRGDGIRDDDPARTLKRMGQILSEGKRADAGGTFDYVFHDKPFHIGQWEILVAAYGPRARVLSQTLIRLQNEAGPSHTMFDVLAGVGGADIVAYLFETLPRINKQANAIANDPDVSKPLPNNDPRQEWLSAQWEIQLAIDNCAGQMFQTDEQRLAWWKANQNKTPEQWLRDSLAQAARQADASDPAAGSNDWWARTRFRRLLPDAPWGTDEEMLVPPHSNVAGDALPPFREKWLKEHADQLAYDEASGQFRLRKP